MQLPEIPLNPPLRKGETPCLRRTHVSDTVRHIRDLRNENIQQIKNVILSAAENL